MSRQARELSWFAPVSLAVVVDVGSLLSLISARPVCVILIEGVERITATFEVSRASEEN